MRKKLQGDFKTIFILKQKLYIIKKLYWNKENRHYICTNIFTSHQWYSYLTSKLSLFSLIVQVIDLGTQLNSFKNVVRSLKSELGDAEAKTIFSRAVYLFYIKLSLSLSCKLFTFSVQYQRKIRWFCYW